MTDSAIISKLDSAAADNLGYPVLPSMSKCVSYHLLGVDLPTSIFNLAGGAPMTFVGAGPDAYGADYAEMIATGVITPPFNRSVIIVSTESFQPAQSGPPQTTPTAPYAGWFGGCEVRELEWRSTICWGLMRTRTSSAPAWAIHMAQARRAATAKPPTCLIVLSHCLVGI